MKRFLSIYLILSLFYLGQLNVLKNFQITFDTNHEAVFSHQHEHNFLIILKTTLLGVTIHEHEHDHDESFPWDPAPTHETQAHTHSDLFGFKLEILQSPKIGWTFLSSKNYLGFSLEPSFISSGFRSDIFRPPISA